MRDDAALRQISKTAKDDSTTEELIIQYIFEV